MLRERHLGQPTYHHTAPMAMRVGHEELGLELIAAGGHRLPELASVIVPVGVDSAAYLPTPHNR